MKLPHVFFLLFIFLIAFGVRLYKATMPLADWHSWRQADTAAVARNFEKNGIDLLRPTYDDFSNIQSGKDNPHGYRMVEFPLYQAAAVLAHTMLPMFPIEVVLRMVSAASVAGSVIVLGLLLLRFLGRTEAIIGVIVYTFLPYSIFYGRTILPDSFAIFWALLSLFLLTKKETIWFVAASVCAAVSLLVRPMAAFVLLPAFFFAWERYRFVWYWVIAALPLLGWRQWIGHFPEGIPASDWLFNKNDIRFRGAWFYWLFARRLGELILGWWGLLPFAMGFLVKGKSKIVSFLWLLGALLYFIIFAGGNVQHDYYQALIMPVVVWFTALGGGFLYKNGGRILLFVSLIFCFAFSWYTVRTYYWVNRPEIVEAGIAADQLLPQNAKVIAPYNGDTTFLYQTNRPGWPIGFEIDKKIQMGATHYVTISPTDTDLETKDLAEKYTVLVRNDKYAIIDLTHEK